VRRVARRRAALAYLALALVVPCLALALIVPNAANSANTAGPLALGFYDSTFNGTDSHSQTLLHRAALAGADWVRVDVGWVAPDTRSRPTGFNARDPADPHYHFGGDDAMIKHAAAEGLKVLAVFTGAPRWAEGPNVPADVTPGTWRPDPGGLEDYGAALAARYSGHFPDPAEPGHNLPRVAAFQLWNEPNLNAYLNPQWNGARPAAPAIYRAMLNGFYAGVKSIDPSAAVVTAGTGPFGDPYPGGPRIMPVVFWKSLLCLRQVGRGLRSTGCSDPAHFDLYAHHPYSVGPPTTTALDADDISIPDLGKVTRLVRAAERFGDALPHIHHPLWITEVSYNSWPPAPGGVPIGTHAHWLEQTLAELWQQGAATVFWNQVGDQPPIPSYAATSQSGVYRLSGKPKPALQAFRFPLVTWREGHHEVEVWGRAPASGSVEIQERSGSTWRTVRSLGEPAHAVFTILLPARGPVTVRAQVAGINSLAWHQG
jgi:hypothetical protein